MTVNGQPAYTYADFIFASSNAIALNDGANTFTNIAQNYYGTVKATNLVAVNLPQNVTLQFDANGNLTNDGSRVFGYDAENQLTNVNLAGAWRKDFLYDGFNRRRIVRDYLWQSGVWAVTNETCFTYDGNAVIQEWDSTDVNSGVRRQAGWAVYGRGRMRMARPTTMQMAAGISRPFWIPTNTLPRAMNTTLYGRLLGKWGRLAGSEYLSFCQQTMGCQSRLLLFWPAVL